MVKPAASQNALNKINCVWGDTRIDHDHRPGLHAGRSGQAESVNAVEGDIVHDVVCAGIVPAVPPKLESGWGESDRRVVMAGEQGDASGPAEENVASTVNEDL